MNHYGMKAMRHWAEFLPRRYQEIRDPETFFTRLGERASQEIGDLMMDLAGDSVPGQDYHARAGQFRMARMMAEEAILPELILLPAESQET